MKQRIVLDTDEVAQLKKQGLSDASVGEKLGVSQQVVRNWRRMHDIPCWVDGEPTRWRDREQKTFRQSLLPQVVDMILNQGMSKLAVSRKLGITTKTIRRWLGTDEANGIIQAENQRDEPSKERLIFDYICWYKRQHDGNSPSRVEIARYINSSPSTLGYYLDLLSRENKLSVDMSGLTAGQISVVGGVWRPPMWWSKPPLRSLTDEERKNRTAKRSDRIKQYAYDFICIYKGQHNGNAPLVSMIAKQVNAPDATVYMALQNLRDEGRIRMPPNKKTSKIEVVGANWWPPSNWREPATPMKQEKVTAISVKRRNELKRHGMLCACQKGKTKWVMTVPVGKNGNDLCTYRLCDNCARLAVEAGDMVFPINQGEELS